MSNTLTSEHIAEAMVNLFKALDNPNKDVNINSELLAALDILSHTIELAKASEKE